MTTSVTEQQLLLIKRVGDVNPLNGDPVQPTLESGTGIVAENIVQLWNQYAAKALVSDDLRDLHVLVAAQDLCIGVLERYVDNQAVDNAYQLSLSDRVKARKGQREGWQRDIDRILGQIASGSTAVSGVLARTAPIAPPVPGERPQVSTYGPDANSPVYSGSPYWPRRRWGY